MKKSEFLLHPFSLNILVTQNKHLFFLFLKIAIMNKPKNVMSLCRNIIIFTSYCY